ncbi:MAG: type II TA system antitoxin MqsA family protein [Myxococcota bacterium]
MKHCARCRTGKLEKTVAPDSVEVGEHLFTARVPALKCRECEELYLDGPSLERFELRVAVELARAGEASGDVMRFMRKAAGLRARELAELLGVTPETVSRWETGKQPMEHRAMAVVGSLVVERFEGRTSTLDNLRALQHPRRLARRIEFSLAELSAS